MGLIFIGYPLGMWVISKVRHNPVHRKDIFPPVSIVTAAYNEAENIGEMLENKLVLDYPQDRLEVIVVSDGSTDATAEIVKKYAERGVRLLRQGTRAGKTEALNWAVSEAGGEIIVFADANSLYGKDAVKKLVRNFADAKVGYVTGKMVYVDVKGSLVAGGCSAYMRYENFLRGLESQCGSLVGVDGGIDAVRKDLYETLQANLLPDLVLPLKVIEKGYRVVYEEEAVLNERSLSRVRDELKMRVRVILRSFDALWYMKRLFNPFVSGGYALQLLVHKLLRYWVGFLQLGALVGNIFLLGQGPLYPLLLVVQCLGYGGALVGGWIKGGGRTTALFGHFYYFCLLNGAAVWAFFKFLKGEKQVIWVPRKGS